MRLRGMRGTKVDDLDTRLAEGFWGLRGWGA